jgi:hypothetical protein
VKPAQCHFFPVGPCGVRPSRAPAETLKPITAVADSLFAALARDARGEANHFSDGPP